jgi:hypothetical protein
MCCYCVANEHAYEFHFTDIETGKPVKRDCNGKQVYKFNILITTWEIVMVDRDSHDGLLSEVGLF